MHQIMPAVFLSASVALGLYLGWQYLQHVRAKPAHIAIHLILGFAGLEMMAMLFRGTPDGDVLEVGWQAKLAGLLLVGAVISGFITPMVARRQPRRMTSLALGIHVAFGAVGFLLFLSWILLQRT